MKRREEGRRGQKREKGGVIPNQDLDHLVRIFKIDETDTEPLQKMEIMKGERRKDGMNYSTSNDSGSTSSLFGSMMKWQRI